MPTSTLPSASPLWTRPAKPSSVIAPWAELTLTRNLADYPFPFCASDDELRACEARILGALEKAGLTSRGAYIAMGELSGVDQQQLVERRLASEDLSRRTGPRGVWVRDDQGMSVMLNGTDHLTVRCTVSGHDAESAWQAINQWDNLLSRLLDFAFDSRRGYLTSVLDNVGTGLRLRCLLHLPALNLADALVKHAENAARHGMLLCGARRAGNTPGPLALPRGDVPAPPLPDWAVEHLHADPDTAIFASGAQALGDLYMLCSHATLGRSEPELVFALQHTAAELVAAEETARAQLLGNGRIGVEDRVGRAIGVASRARLVGFEEGYALLSALRLGAACHLPDTPAVDVLNELLIGCQGAHLAHTLSGEPRSFALSEARAARLRALYGAK